MKTPKATNFMGGTLPLRQWSNAQLQQHIRRVASLSERVVFTEHAYGRMALRSVSDLEVLECLRQGVIQRPPQTDKSTGSLKCRMEFFGTSRNLAVIVALDDDNPDVIVVTVIARTR